MAETFKFELVSPERLLISLDAQSVLVPGDEGDFVILPNHSPVMSTLRPGLLTITSEDGETQFFVKGGFAEASPTSLTILAEFAIEFDDLKGDVLEGQLKIAKDELLNAEGDLAIKQANDCVSCLEVL